MIRDLSFAERWVLTDHSMKSSFSNSAFLTRVAKLLRSRDVMRQKYSACNAAPNQETLNSEGFFIQPSICFVDLGDVGIDYVPSPRSELGESSAIEASHLRYSG